MDVAGTRKADDAWIDRMANQIADASREQAAEAVAAALAEGFSTDDVGEAISLAANQLVLRDPGRRPQGASPEKPEGSVHGDSVGVHASDAANAWRNIAGVSNARNAVASLIVGAFHTAGQTGSTRKELVSAYAEHLEKVTATDAETLLKELDGAIQEQDQFRACAIVHEVRPRERRCAARVRRAAQVRRQRRRRLARGEVLPHGDARNSPAPAPAFRWRQLVALARVTASEYGRPAPGYKQACELLKVS